MSIFSFWKKPKTDVELFEEECAKMKNDEEIPLDIMTSFFMEIEDVFQITGRGTVATGKIVKGTVTVGDVLFLHRKDGTQECAAVSGIVLLRKLQNTASVGDNVGILLPCVAKNEVDAGDVLIR